MRVENYGRLDCNSWTHICIIYIRASRIQQLVIGLRAPMWHPDQRVYHTRCWSYNNTFNVCVCTMTIVTSYSWHLHPATIYLISVFACRCAKENIYVPYLHTINRFSQRCMSINIISVIVDWKFSKYDFIYCGVQLAAVLVVLHNTFGVECTPQE